MKSGVQIEPRKACFINLHWSGLIWPLRYDLTDTAGVLENKVLGMFHGLDDQSVLVEGLMKVSSAIFLCKSD